MKEIVDVTNAVSMTISHEKSSLDKNGGVNTSMNNNNDRSAPANDMSDTKNIAGNERRVRTADRNAGSFRQQQQVVNKSEK